MGEKRQKTLKDLAAELREDARLFLNARELDIHNAAVVRGVFLDDMLAGIADRIDALAKRAYGEIDMAICSMDDDSSTDSDEIRQIMDTNLGDYYG